jgi:alcohol dehydrogenase YqhD (iron-dependent ADH family)
MKLRPGQQVASTVDGTRVIVVRAPSDDVVLTCGGADMVDPAKAAAGEGGVADPGQQDGTVLGKRYTHDGLGLELLCTKPGQGTVAANGEPLVLKESKPLPASD